ncbi:exosortase system-associated protein, TIGR04073 family [Candidatus Omnitrophota bacterium]
MKTEKREPSAYRTGRACFVNKAVAKALIAVILLGIAQPVYCDNALDKLGRGICNTSTCFFEVISQSAKVKEEKGSIAGMTLGLAKGVMMTMVRAVVGVYEIATFPVPFPGGYKPILTDPENFISESYT